MPRPVWWQVPKDNIVVTQPVTGEFRAFSAVCPHVSCLLDKVANGAMETPVNITVAGGAITIT